MATVQENTSAFKIPLTEVSSNSHADKAKEFWTDNILSERLD